MNRFLGNTVIVTGTASGIDALTAKLFSNENADAVRCVFESTNCVYS